MNIALLLLIASLPLPAPPRVPVKAYLVYEHSWLLALELEGRVNAYQFGDIRPKSMIVDAAWYEPRELSAGSHRIFARLVPYRGRAPQLQDQTNLSSTDIVFSRVEYSDGTFVEKGKRP